MLQSNNCCQVNCNKADKIDEGDDTMSATTQNYVYQVYGKKNSEKKEPVVSQDRLAKIKQTVGKYLGTKE